ncbi:hypothetical protein, partial [Pontibacillus yanchengensis]|uniref:hypothetical protein n=1 Tax=Pontibacillus yanchengensis TaxID=462910 RepID=UPI001F396CCF
LFYMKATETSLFSRPKFISTSSLQDNGATMEHQPTAIGKSVPTKRLHNKQSLSFNKFFNVYHSSRKGSI